MFREVRDEDLQLAADRDLEERYRSVVPAPNNVPYVMAVVAMLFMSVSAVVAVVVLRPITDNSAIITAIVGLTAPTTLSLLAFMKSQETHLSVNSRLDAFMSNARFAAHARGVIEGRAHGAASADARTDTLKIEEAEAVRKKYQEGP